MDAFWYVAIFFGVGFVWALFIAQQEDEGAFITRLAIMGLLSVIVVFLFVEMK